MLRAIGRIELEEPGSYKNIEGQDLFALTVKDFHGFATALMTLEQAREAQVGRVDAGHAAKQEDANALTGRPLAQLQQDIFYKSAIIYAITVFVVLCGIIFY